MSMFNFVKIVVSDLPAMEAFYTGALGFQVQNRIDAPGFKEVMLAQKAGAFTLVLYHHTDGRRIDNGNGWGPLGFIVRDCDADHARLISHGAAEARAPASFGAMKVSFVTDPEGHEIELLQLPAAA